ncbi:MAG: response regulator [Thermodesulfobacteriota bacterium]|nr:response regulator [Thermodesulfobacteriota bacterium]
MNQTVILLVDDEAPFVETMTKRLGKRSYNVLTAFSGQEALAELKTAKGAKVDVIILDVKMPVMDGVETLSEIKRLYPLIEVIMLTGHATIESGIEGMKLGAFDYLMKPTDMDHLVAKIEEAGAKKRRHEAKILEARAQMIALRRGD